MTSTKLTTLFSVLIAATALFFTGCNSNSGSVSTNVSLDSEIDSVSYSLGYQIAAMSLKRQGMTDIKPAKFASGLKTALSEDSSMLSDAEMQQVVQTYQMEAQQRAQKKQQQKAEENRKEGEEFLAGNKNNEGVQITDSGLQYKVLEEGSGVSPDSSDQVRVHYKGTLLDGETFDSSYDRGEPVEFPLNQVIPGWSEGVQLMKEGAK
ncbi:MAG TPA: FKBP-type peptidyl-prolyl cis-trans isomerase N-terminal domain-containing protein, partial [Fodinibius sp.]|nr:FKBP-type peptidyl-prolyl cis-trans isomerase N-terminal domain-containing protein [Fodinibius sp.]